MRERLTRRITDRNDSGPQRNEPLQTNLVLRFPSNPVRRTADRSAPIYGPKTGEEMGRRVGLQEKQQNLPPRGAPAKVHHRGLPVPQRVHTEGSYTQFENLKTL